MRRLEFLINQVRQSTDNKDTNGILDQEIELYFNDAQKYIETLIFKSNPYADIFKSQSIQPASTNGEYTLPEDCFSLNSISMVEVQYSSAQTNDGYVKISPISEAELAYSFGYIIRDNKLIISGKDGYAGYANVRITYFRHLKSLGIRQAKVTAVTPNTSISLSAAPLHLYNVDDHCSTVDAAGDQVVSDIYFTNTSGSSLTTTDTTGVAANQYVVAGKNSCNKSELPDICETYLLDYVRQRMYGRNNYNDAGKQEYFTSQQKEQIVSIFSKNKKDSDSLPVTDTDFLVW